MPCSYGLKKTLPIDAALLAEAREATGDKMDTETIRLAVEATVRSAAYR